MVIYGTAAGVWGAEAALSTVLDYHMHAIASLDETKLTPNWFMHSLLPRPSVNVYAEENPEDVVPDLSNFTDTDISAYKNVSSDARLNEATISSSKASSSCKAYTFHDSTLIDKLLMYLEPTAQNTRSRALKHRLHVDNDTEWPNTLDDEKGEGVGKGEKRMLPIVNMDSNGQALFLSSAQKRCFETYMTNGEDDHWYKLLINAGPVQFGEIPVPGSFRDLYTPPSSQAVGS